LRDCGNVVWASGRSKIHWIFLGSMIDAKKDAIVPGFVTFT
jgi:hypothetical protein